MFRAALPRFRLRFHVTRRFPQNLPEGRGEEKPLQNFTGGSQGGFLELET